MAGNLIYITDAGRAALVAPGNTGTTARQVTQIGLATAAFVFKPDMTALPSELKRITTFGGDTVAKDTIHIVIQDDSADQYKLYGFGLYLDNGVLFGVYVQNDPILEKAAASMLLLAADTVFASIDVTELVFGPTSFLNPPATTERKGIVELATQDEVDAGTDDTRAVTPKTVAIRYAALTGARFTGHLSAAAGMSMTYATIDNGAGWSTISLKNNGKNRWTIGKSDTDDFAISSFDDDGVTQRRVLDIPRASQVISFAKRPSWAGATPWDNANLTPLDRNIGGQVNGTVTLYGAGDYGSSLVFNANGYAPRIQAQASSRQLMIANAANTAANLVIQDNGTVSFPRARPNWAGLTPWDTGNFDPNAKINRGGDTMNGRLYIARDGWDADFGLRSADGWQTFLRARRGGGLELINSAYNAVPAFFEDNGTLHIGAATIQNDGNIWLPWAGQWLNNMFGGGGSIMFNRNGNGAWRHNSGFMIQWGYLGGGMAEGHPPVINFPVAFPSACVCLNATAHNSAGTNQADQWIQMRWWNNAGFQAFVQSSGQGSIDGFFWTAFGW